VGRQGGAYGLECLPRRCLVGVGQQLARKGGVADEVEYVVDVVTEPHRLGDRCDRDVGEAGTVEQLADPAGLGE
jgi:hypothetical protein